MKIIPAMKGIFEIFASVTSFCFASSPTSIVQAFSISSTRATAALRFRRAHRLDLSKQLPTDPRILENGCMTKTSAKDNVSDENTPSSLPSPSYLDFVVAKIGSTTSMVVAGTFFIVLCYKRDALMVSFFLGAISNAIFGKVLKKILKIERPEVSVAENARSKEVLAVPRVDQPNDNGMPSSHAMSLGFICTFVALLLPNTTVPLMAYAAISLIYRVRVNLHSVDQIAVGAILGTFDGAAWWHLCIKGFRGFNVVDFVSSTGIINESGQLHWYLLTVPLMVGAAVVGSVERRLGKFFKSADSEESKNQKQD